MWSQIVVLRCNIWAVSWLTRSFNYLDEVPRKASSKVLARVHSDWASAPQCWELAPATQKFRRTHTTTKNQTNIQNHDAVLKKKNNNKRASWGVQNCNTQKPHFLILFFGAIAVFSLLIIPPPTVETNFGLESDKINLTTSKIKIYKSPITAENELTIILRLGRLEHKNHSFWQL